MNATSMFWPSASSPRSVDGPSASTSSRRDHVADLHQRALVDAGVLVRALELWSGVDVDAGIVSPGSRLGSRTTTMRPASTWSTTPPRRRHDRARVARDARSMPVPTSGAAHAGGTRLALHVRAHQRAVGVVVLEERHGAAATDTVCIGETSMYRCRSAAAALGTRRW